MTATHLKRLFASQDSNTTDTIVSGQTVVVDDTEEAKSRSDEKAEIACSIPELQKPPGQPIPSPEDDLSEVPQLVLDTPIPRPNPLESENIGVAAPAVELLEQPQSEMSGLERLYDSDSTISALPFISKPRCRGGRQIINGGESSTSGMDGDPRALPSRLPRRSKPTPT